MKTNFTTSYEVEADWLLLTSCNNRCPYCYLSPKHLSAEVPTGLSPQMWQRAFDRTRKIWHLHISGGEPFLYPNFIQLCEHLSRRHVLSINTNLTSSFIPGFIQSVNLSKIEYINASLHYEELSRKKMHQRFKENFHRLREAGIFVFVTMVMTPHACIQIPSIYEEYLSQGIWIMPKIFRGHWADKYFPDGYSQEEKKIFNTYYLRSREWYNSQIERFGVPTIDMRLDAQWLEGEPDFRGRRCQAGHCLVSIDEKANVWKCGAKDSMGNILEETFTLASDSKICDTKFCPYYCVKYSQ